MKVEYTRLGNVFFNEPYNYKSKFNKDNFTENFKHIRIETGDYIYHLDVSKELIKGDCINKLSKVSSPLIFKGLECINNFKKSIDYIKQL